MTLKKQSIRSGVNVSINGKIATKEELITLSESWSENQENIFRKMLQQGGSFKIKDLHFIISTGDRILNSRGEKDGGVKQIPGIDERF
jgi:hypothetical protein